MKNNRSLLMCALPAALALVAASAQAEGPKLEAKTSFKTESPTMARSVKDWHPEQSGPTTAAKPATTPPAVETTQPAEEMTQSPVTPGVLPLQPGQRSERAQEIPLKSIPQ